MLHKKRFPINKWGQKLALEANVSMLNLIEYASKPTPAV